MPLNIPLHVQIDGIDIDILVKNVIDHCNYVYEPMTIRPYYVYIIMDSKF